MNNLENIFNDVSTIGEYSKKYFSYLNKLLNSINEMEINKLADIFETTRDKGNTIFVAGNGGSSTTAMTMVNDIGFDTCNKTNIDKAFKLHSLVDNNSLITSIANDLGYENIFTTQLKIYYSNGDSIILISASGNSPNIIEAAKWVKSRGGKIISFTGFEGGILTEISDIKIHIKSEIGEYGPVEDAHLIINHILANWFQNKLK